MTISVQIIEDSISEADVRLTSFQLRYPRFIHAELMTHKSFSRSASSSRAIPVQKIIAAILADPAEPIEWGSNKRGMQAGEPLQGWRLWAVRRAWHFSKRCAILAARVGQAVGVHKQVINRILEPWSHISVVLTATDFKNFFALRCHKDADPTFQELAKLMRGAYMVGSPKLLKHGEWHLPYITDVDREAWHIEDLLEMSSARCARVSYNNHFGIRANIHEDKKLFKQLTGGELVHASPTEHQATPDRFRLKPNNESWNDLEKHGNLRGWKQHRKFIDGEFIEG